VCRRYIVFFLSDTASAETYTLSLHDALPICGSGCALRKVSFQILLIENRVNIPVNKAKKAATQIPASRLALTRTNLAQKPDSGGMPANDNAGMAKRMASNGVRAYSPPIAARRSDPLNLAAMPPTKNRLALTTIW